MKLKNGIIAICLLFAGMVNAQEPKTPPTPAPMPPPPAKTVDLGLGDYENSEIVYFPDVEAEFDGGAKAFTKFIQENVHYPKEASDKGLNGRVYVTFIVELDGSITNVQILRGEHEVLNNEAIRLVEKMPNWIPGKQNGENVRTMCRLPITFTL